MSGACLVGWFLALGFGSLPQSELRGFRLGRVELHGPLQAVAFDCGAAGSTHVVGSLSTGEQRVLLLPFPESPVADAPRTELDGAGSASWLGWEAEPAAAAFPRSIHPRVRPALRSRTLGIPLETVLVVCAALILTRVLRRRPRVLVAVVLSLASVSGWSVARQREPDAELALVWEGARAAEIQAVTVTGVRLPGIAYLELARLQVAREGAPQHWTVPLAGGAGGKPVADLECGGGEVTLSRSLLADRGAGKLRRTRNDFRDLDAIWLRESSGGWQAHGAWKRGESLPDKLEGGPQPPGWLRSGLPQGRSVLLGRATVSEAVLFEVLSGGAEAGLASAGDSGPSSRSRTAWIRWVGF